MKIYLPHNVSMGEACSMSNSCNITIHFNYFFPMISLLKICYTMLDLLVNIKAWDQQVFDKIIYNMFFFAHSPLGKAPYQWWIKRLQDRDRSLDSNKEGSIRESTSRSFSRHQMIIGLGCPREKGHHLSSVRRMKDFVILA